MKDEAEFLYRGMYITLWAREMFTVIVPVGCAGAAYYDRLTKGKV